MFPIEFLRRSARFNPGKVAVIEGEARCTYQTLLSRAEALGMGLRSLSGKDRPVVAVLGPNSISMLVSLMAVHASGTIFVPLNGRNARAELEAQVEFARPDVVIVHADYLGKMTLSGLTVVVTDGPAPDGMIALGDLEAEHAGQRPVIRADLSEQNAIKFTGGSSGKPKGVNQPFRSMNTLVASLLIAFEFREDEVYLCAAPMTHGAGSFLLPILARGGTIVMTGDPSPANLLDLMAVHQVTTLWVPPTLLYKLIEEQRAAPRGLASLRHLIWGAAPAATARLQEAAEVFGPVIEVVYGQTETPLLVASGRASELTGARIASVGRAGPLAEIGILGPDGQLLGPNELGEICTRGDLLMTGYIDLPEENAKTLRDGWLYTGDVGLMDEDGFLFIKDRSRDVIITGGFNVYPSDVEAALAAHEAVSECVVFGIPDDYWGEKVEASLELRPGMTATPEELIAHCKAQLGSVKAPKQIHIVTTLPRSPVGKVLRRIARENAMASAEAI